jgi:PAS domain S-box-containing protein
MTTKIKVLILEHDPNDLELLQYELKKGSLEYESIIAQTKESFEEALHNFYPDIILSDYNLPNFDGLSAFRIRQALAPQTPFIIVSGTIGDEKAVELIKTGVTDYVLKEKMYQIVPKIYRALREASERQHKIMAEQQLQQSREQLQKIMDLSLDVICTVDKEGSFVTIGAASKQVWGYLPEELIGVKFIDLVHEEDVAYTLQVIADIMKGIEVTNLETRCKRKEGGLISVLWSARWDANESQYYCIARDASAFKKAEETLMNYANELKRSNIELEQFAFITSHDLQEPLRTIMGFLNLLENKYAQQLDDKARQYIHFAVDGATRMRRIILDLLEYSRVGQQADDIKEIDMNKLLEEAVQLHHAIIQEKGAVIEWETLPVIRASRTSLLQIWQNLIGNALKYQQPDKKPLIKINVTETASHWQFSVADNGIGIKPQFFEKIFIVFQRLHSRNEYTGTGIGLAICKKNIENHQGTIWVESIDGQGSTFYFTIKKKL